MGLSASKRLYQHSTSFPFSTPPLKFVIRSTALALTRSFTACWIAWSQSCCCVDNCPKRELTTDSNEFLSFRRNDVSRWGDLLYLIRPTADTKGAFFILLLYDQISKSHKTNKIGTYYLSGTWNMVRSNRSGKLGNSFGTCYEALLDLETAPPRAPDKDHQNYKFFPANRIKLLKSY